MKVKVYLDEIWTQKVKVDKTQLIFSSGVLTCLPASCLCVSIILELQYFIYKIIYILQSFNEKESSD